jgi:hypothetical protein
LVGAWINCRPDSKSGPQGKSCIRGKSYTQGTIFQSRGAGAHRGTVIRAFTTPHAKAITHIDTKAVAARNTKTDADGYTDIDSHAVANADAVTHTETNGNTDNDTNTDAHAITILDAGAS